jgi:pilus assembly protein CpaB
MNPRRIALALIAALVLSGGVTFFLARKINNRTSVHLQTQRWVAASRPVLAGEVLRPENLALIDWPRNLPITGGFSKISDVAGRAVIYPLADGQPVLDRYLAAAGSGIGLTVKIPEGMRATSLRSNEVVGVAGFLFPGSRVDVLVTYRSEQTTATATQIVVQDAEVLTAGQNIEPDPQGKPQTVNVVTLLLNPHDTQKVVLASTQGTIQFVLRNGADRGRVQSAPVAMAELGGTETVAKVAHAPAASAARHSYSVETVVGDKRQTINF